MKNSQGVNNNNNTWTLPENKKIWDIRVTVLPIVVGALGMIPKILGKKLEEFKIRVKNIS